MPVAFAPDTKCKLNLSSLRNSSSMAKKRTTPDERGINYRELEQVSPPQSPSSSESDRAALEEALNETLNQESYPSIGQEALAALNQVAQRYPGSKLSLDPITVELVDSILWMRISRQGQSASYWLEMSREIAVLLYESPASKERLVNLWDSLLGAFK
jgi:hypothetical protein